MELIPVLLFFGPTWILAILYYRFSMRPHLHSPLFQTLNSNLAKVDQFWSFNECRFKPLSAGELEADLAKARRSFWIMAALLSLLSIIGTLLLILALISGHPRLERNTLASLLATDPNLSPETVRATIREMESLI